MVTDQTDTDTAGVCRICPRSLQGNERVVGLCANCQRNYWVKKR